MAEPAPRPYDDLTIPTTESTSAREVLSLAIRRALSDLRHLSPDHAADEAQRLSYMAFRAQMVELLKHDRGAIYSLMRQPTVAVFVRALRDRVPEQPASGAMLGELVATACLDLAAAKSLPRPIRLGHLPERLVCLPGRFVLEIPAGVTALTLSDGRAVLEVGSDHREIDLTDPAGEKLPQPFHTVDGGIQLAVADNNPLSMFEAHPDKGGNTIDLGGRAADQWCSALRTALSLVGEHLPALREEMGFFLHQLVPVGFDRDAHLSASYQEAIGTAYMTLHPRPMTMAEALIHEFSHNKINALFELDPLLDNAFHPLFSSPVRPDPRPLHGILLAVHAFLPVARLYERMTEEKHPWSTESDFKRRFREIVQKNHEGASVLRANAEPTRIGKALLDEIARWDFHFQRLLAEG